MNVIRPLSSLVPDNGKKICLILLNRPIEIELMKNLWRKSILTAVADGATNWLIKNCGDQKDEFIPDFISGDFDSAEASSLDYYRNKSVEIITTEDQNETDFTKCLRLVAEKVDEDKIDQIVALGALGGRFDHTLASINTLYTALNLFKKPVVLLDEGSMVCLLNKGSHSLLCDTGHEGDWCGLVPVGQPAACVTTTGLKYNLTKDRMSFGELISTSNTLVDSTVTLTSDQPLVWTLGYKD